MTSKKFDLSVTNGISLNPYGLKNNTFIKNFISPDLINSINLNEKYFERKKENNYLIFQEKDSIKTNDIS